MGAPQSNPLNELAVFGGGERPLTESGQACGRDLLPGTEDCCPDSRLSHDLANVPVWFSPGARPDIRIGVRGPELWSGGEAGAKRDQPELNSTSSVADPPRGPVPAPNPHGDAGVPSAPRTPVPRQARGFTSLSLFSSLAHPGAGRGRGENPPVWQDDGCPVGGQAASGGPEPGPGAQGRRAPPAPSL